MIRVTIDMIDFRLTMDGHAEAPREGEYDLVCCAASTISQQLLYSLEEYQTLHDGIDKLDYDMTSGHLYIRARAKEWARASIRSRFCYMREGMDMLADRYPEYISVKEE